MNPTLPKPLDFLAHLKRKGGFADAPLPPSVKAYRFATESF